MDNAYKLDRTRDAERILLGKDVSRIVTRPVPKTTARAIKMMTDRVGNTSALTDLEEAESILQTKNSCAMNNAQDSCELKKLELKVHDAILNSSKYSCGISDTHSDVNKEVINKIVKQSFAKSKPHEALASTLTKSLNGGKVAEKVISAKKDAIDSAKLLDNVSKSQPMDSRKKAALEKAVDQIGNVSSNIRKLKDSSTPTKITNRTELKEWKKKPRPLQQAQVMRVDNVDSFAETESHVNECNACGKECDASDKKDRAAKFAAEMKKFRESSANSAEATECQKMEKENLEKKSKLLKDNMTGHVDMLEKKRKYLDEFHDKTKKTLDKERRDREGEREKKEAAASKKKAEEIKQKED